MKKSFILDSSINVTQVNQSKELPFFLKKATSFLSKTSYQTQVNLSDLFLEEKNSTFDFRFGFIIDQIASNCLLKISGDNSYDTVVEEMDFDEETQTFNYDEDEVMFNENGWYYYLSGITQDQCQRIYLEPQPSRFEINNNNWRIGLYSTYEIDKDKVLIGLPVSSGIPLLSYRSITYKETPTLVFTSYIDHNLIAGDTINIYGNPQLQGEHTVYKVGDENNTNKVNSFMIQFSLNTPLNLTGGDVTFKKVINEIECQYYFRKVKRISQYNPIVGQLAYSLNIYGDNRISLAFEDINIENVRDHLNRNLTELFLGIIKKPATVWTNPISGIMTNFSYSNYDINSIYQDGPTSFLESILSDTNDFYLDIVEFDIYNYRETPLSLVNHRFNLINRKDNGYLEGYYHIPFYKIDLDIISKSVQRSSQFSTSFSVEENDINYWRNNVPYSESSTIKHLNGKNYINLYNAMFVKRQTPCNNITLGLQNPILGKCVDLTSDISNLNEDQSC